jgi:hypothetical protein
MNDKTAAAETQGERVGEKYKSWNQRKKLYDTQVNLFLGLGKYAGSHFISLTVYPNNKTHRQWCT